MWWKNSSDCQNRILSRNLQLQNSGEMEPGLFYARALTGSLWYSGIHGIGISTFQLPVTYVGCCCHGNWLTWGILYKQFRKYSSQLRPKYWNKLYKEEPITCISPSSNLNYIMYIVRDLGKNICTNCWKLKIVIWADSRMRWMVLLIWLLRCSFSLFSISNIPYEITVGNLLAQAECSHACIARVTVGRCTCRVCLCYYEYCMICNNVFAMHEEDIFCMYACLRVFMMPAGLRVQCIYDACYDCIEWVWFQTLSLSE